MLQHLLQLVNHSLIAKDFLVLSLSLLFWDIDKGVGLLLLICLAATATSSG
jgi:hypothetical protein